MTHTKTGMFKNWHGIEWRQLPSGDSVALPVDEELAIVSVFFEDKHERPRDFPLALNGRVVSHVEINGVRYVRAPEHVDGCEVLD